MGGEKYRNRPLDAKTDRNGIALKEAPQTRANALQTFRHEMPWIGSWNAAKRDIGGHIVMEWSFWHVKSAIEHNGD